MFDALRKNIQISKFVFKFCKNYIWYTIVYIIMNVISSLSKVYIIKKAVEDIINDTYLNEIKFKKVAVLLILFIVITIITTIYKTIYENHIQTKYRLMYSSNIQHLMYERIKYFDYQSFDDPEFYNHYSRALRDGAYRGIRVYEDFTKLISSICISIALGAFIVISDLFLVFIVLISAIINVIINIKANKLWYKLDKENEKHNRMLYYINRTFYQQKYRAEIKTTIVGKLLIERFNETYDDINKSFMKTQKKQSILSLIRLFSNYFFIYFLEYIYLGFKLFYRGLSVAVFTSTITACQQFNSSFKDAALFIDRIKLNSLYIDDFLWFINYKPSLETKGEEKLLSSVSSIKLDDVSFKYPSTSKNVIDNMSLNIKKGEKVAIVGLNGAGKSTIIKLLLKFYLQDKGTISFNNQNIIGVMENDIRSSFSCLFQDYELFATTIGENILMRKLENEIDRNKCLESLEKVGMKDKILSLPKGLDTIVTREFDDKGAVFSGGEIQKIAISRIFASDRDVYVLDEPTSNLDPFSEKKINDLIIQNKDDKIVIIIAHRLSTVVDCDKIILIENGKIIESGTHNELLNAKGKYQKMFLTQAALYRKK